MHDDELPRWTAGRRDRDGRSLRRRPVLVACSALALSLMLSACMGDQPDADDYAPVSYDYLTPLRLNVAEIEVRDDASPSREAGEAPVPPALALRRIAADRLKPGGTTGRAVFVILDATIRRSGRSLDGAMAVRLDIVAADGTRAGYADARVERRQTGVPERSRRAVYDLVRQMSDDMNVELEFQIRRSLRDWLQVPTTAPAPAPVEQQDLAQPPPRPAP